MTRTVFNMEITRSKKLLVYLLVIHILMLITLLSLLNVSVLFLLMLLVLVSSCIYYCQQYQWIKSSRAIIEVMRCADKQWTLVRRSSKDTDLTLKSSLITPYFVILNFQGQSSTIWKNNSITIMNDAVDIDLYRQLCVYCRDPKTFQQ